MLPFFNLFFVQFPSVLEVGSGNGSSFSFYYSSLSLWVKDCQLSVVDLKGFF